MNWYLVDLVEYSFTFECCFLPYLVLTKDKVMCEMKKLCYWTIECHEIQQYIDYNSLIILKSIPDNIGIEKLSSTCGMLHTSASAPATPFTTIQPYPSPKFIGLYIKATAIQVNPQPMVPTNDFPFGNLGLPCPRRIPTRDAIGSPNERFNILKIATCWGNIAKVTAHPFRKWSAPGTWCRSWDRKIGPNVVINFRFTEGQRRRSKCIRKSRLEQPNKITMAWE